MARQVIALLFTDIVDSTALFGSLGLDRADAVRRDHDQAVAGAVTRAGGTVVKHTGDGIMAAFPGPSAAVEAAVADVVHIEQGQDVGEVAAHTSIEPWRSAAREPGARIGG